jgi:hypothetical protein
MGQGVHPESGSSFLLERGLRLVDHVASLPYGGYRRPY